MLPVITKPFTEHGVTFQTGRPATFRYLHGTKKAPYYGSRFQQDIEPAGFYCVHVTDDIKPREDYEVGSMSVESPMLLPLNTVPFNTYDENSWKVNLHKHYRKKGKALSQAIIKDGFDSVVTLSLDNNLKPYDTREIVVFNKRNPVEGHQTAMKRKTISAPMRWLHDNRYLRGRMLDYGSGRGYDAAFLGMEAYDPHWHPHMPEGKFDTITSNYVLNVVNPTAIPSILNDIFHRLKYGGSAYITVRRDIPKEGTKGRGTYQRYVELDLPTLKKTSAYQIYYFSKEK